MESTNNIDVIWFGIFAFVAIFTVLAIVIGLEERTVMYFYALFYSITTGLGIAALRRENWTKWLQSESKLFKKKK